MAYKSKKAWIASSFEDFFAPTNATGQNRQKSSEEIAQNTDTWNDKFAPKQETDLAVHKKKIEEVRQWLVEHVSQRTKATILLLTGPAGSGKTATMQVLANELGLSIIEWSNPTSDSMSWSDRQSSDYHDGGSVYVGHESQANTFRDFLLRANRYPSLDIFQQDQKRQQQLQGQVIVVEEFPNVFNKDVQQFHNILRSYAVRGSGPLVFIVSSSSSTDSLDRRLFPDSIQTELRVDNISFNLVAKTMLTRALSRVVALVAKTRDGQFEAPSCEAIESLVTSSSGDIRAAVNALQFACTKVAGMNSSFSNHSSRGSSKSFSQSHRKGRGKASSQKSAVKPVGGGENTDTPDSHLSPIGAKDTTFVLFRALGKILYCKRAEADTPCLLPAHLSHCHRRPLLMEPEVIMEHCQTRGDIFTSFLHQNYLDFSPDLTCVTGASAYLSDADFLTSQWTSREVMESYASSLASRSILFCNSSPGQFQQPPASHGWKALHKPQWFAVAQKYTSASLAAKRFFPGVCQGREELLTSYLPYLSVINKPLSSPAQIALVQDLGKFNMSPYRKRSAAERLGEDDYDVTVTGDTSFGGADFALLPSAPLAVGTAPSLMEDAALFSNDDVRDDELFNEACDDRETDTCNKSSGEQDEDEDLVIEDFDD